jgi:hypothetical protein
MLYGYSQTNRSEPSQRAKVHRPAYSRRQGCLQNECPEIRHRRASSLYPLRKPADLEALIADYYQRFQPATPEERCFVDILIRDEWQLRRLGAIEAELWEHQLTLVKDDEPYPRGHAFQIADATFARLQRRIDQTERSYKNALHELERLRHTRETSEPDAPPVLRPIENKPVSPQIGFVPQPAEVGQGHALPSPRSASPRFPPPPLRENRKDDTGVSAVISISSDSPQA